MKQSYTISIPVKTFWKKIVPFTILLIVLSSFAGIIIVDRFIMPRIVGLHRDIVSVPNVIGMKYEEAREAFYKAGLLTQLKSKDYDDSIPENCVITQEPPPSSKVKKGRKIAVVVSKGKEVGKIPNVRNLSEKQARILLKNAGFTIGKVNKVFSEEKPADVVIDAFPASGTITSREIDVDLYVSKGPKPTSVEMPNLVGESLNTAKKLLGENNLSIGKISYQNNPSLLPGTVISQSVAPGSNVKLDSKIDLIISVIK